MTQQPQMPTGNRPVVICQGVAYEAANLTEAIALAEDLSHRHHADAYVLKPVKLISPKREFEMKDLA